MDGLIYLLCLLSLALAFMAAWNVRLRSRWHRGQRSIRACQAAQQLLVVMAALQQHRGLGMAYLSGEPGFLERLQAKRGEVDRILPALMLFARSESSAAFPAVTFRELELFCQHWRELGDKLHALSVEQSFAQHGLLIRQILKWLAALGESRIEPAVGGRVATGLVRNYLIRLPELGELLGQARALGTRVASQHACSAVARVRLMFLVARAEAMLAQSLAVSVDIPEAHLATQHIQLMARVVRTQMLLSSGITVDPDAYFSISTQAIDSIFDWIEVSGHWVAAGLENAQELPEACCVV